jgi:hypothetical protein
LLIKDTTVRKLLTELSQQAHKPLSRRARTAKHRDLVTSRFMPNVTVLNASSTSSSIIAASPPAIANALETSKL